MSASSEFQTFLAGSLGTIAQSEGAWFLAPSPAERNLASSELARQARNYIQGLLHGQDR